MSQEYFSPAERSKNEWRLLLRILLFLIAGVAILSTLYLLWGHQVIAYLHLMKSSSIPNIENVQGAAIQGIDFRSLDRFIWERLVPGLPLTLIFAFFCWKLFRYLFGKIEASPISYPQVQETGICRDALIAFACYSICTLLYFYPCLSQISTHLIGPTEDNMLFFWNLSHGWHTVIEHTGNLSYTNSLFFPEGASLYYHSLSFYNVFISFLFTKFFGLVISYNLVILHSFPFAGLGAFLLAKYFIKNSWLAILGGFIFAFSPFHFINALHHMNISSMQFIPFFVLYFIKSVKEKSRWNLWLAALFFLLNALCDWNQMLFGIYFMIFSYIYLAIRRQRWWLPDILTKSAIVVICSVAMLSPWIYKMVLIGLEHGHASGYGHNYYVADLLGLIVPNSNHLLSSLSIIKAINGMYTGNAWETTVYLGLASMAVIIFAFKKILKRAAKYIIGFLAFLLMSLGAHPHILGQTIPIFLPFRILSKLPLLSFCRAPSRHIMYCYLFLSIIAALAVKYLFQWAKSNKWKTTLACLVVVIIFLDFFTVCHSTTEVSVPPCYSVMQSGDRIYGILDLPLGYVESNYYMMYQTFHGLPIVGGALARKTDTTLVDYLEMSDLGKQKIQLDENRVKYIVIHKRFLPRKSLDLAAYKITYNQIYEDEKNIVFEVF